MQVKGFLKLALAVLLSMSYFAGCVLQEKEEEKTVSVVVTLSFFEDMVQRVGGEHVEVKALVPVGVEPEEYDPGPGDVRAIEDAEIFFYNGHNMERWLSRVIPDFKDRSGYYALAEQETIETISLPSGPFEGDPDPHTWTKVGNAKKYLERIAAVLSQEDPENKQAYMDNLEKYRRELRDLDQWIRDEVEKVPREERILITSELCFQYYAKAYGFKHDAIWSINAPEEGSPSQITRLVEVIKEKDPPAVFVENQVDHRPMKRVSRETGVPVKGVLFSDSLSEPGQGGETYLEMMESNTRQIIKALKGDS